MRRIQQIRATSLWDFVKNLNKPRGVCLMVPTGAVDNVIADLLPHIERGDILVDGGNSYYIDDIRRGRGDIPRTPAREKVNGTSEQGYLHCGPHGAGHFVKMVHNGIEYGIMAAFAEGMNILKHANAGKAAREQDAETAPMRNPEQYMYDLPLGDVAEVWRRGSVIASWLLDLTAIALFESPDLANFSGRVSDSGEGRWT